MIKQFRFPDGGIITSSCELCGYDLEPDIRRGQGTLAFGNLTVCPTCHHKLYKKSGLPIIDHAGLAARVGDGAILGGLFVCGVWLVNGLVERHGVIATVVGLMVPVMALWGLYKLYMRFY